MKKSKAINKIKTSAIVYTVVFTGLSVAASLISVLA